MITIPNIGRFTAGLLFVLLHSAIAAESPTLPKNLPPPAYTMSIACFSDSVATRREWIFVIGNTAYRSLDVLKDGITHFPQGSKLTWNPGCIRMDGEPLSSATELKDFEAHCRSHGIHFIMVPSG